jgi:hypothetical protein
LYITIQYETIDRNRRRRHHQIELDFETNLTSIWTHGWIVEHEHEHEYIEFI